MTNWNVLNAPLSLMCHPSRHSVLNNVATHHHCHCHHCYHHCPPSPPCCCINGNVIIVCRIHIVLFWTQRWVRSSAFPCWWNFSAVFVFFLPFSPLFNLSLILLVSDKKLLHASIDLMICGFVKVPIFLQKIENTS